MSGNAPCNRYDFWGRYRCNRGVISVIGTLLVQWRRYWCNGDAIDVIGEGISPLTLQLCNEFVIQSGSLRFWGRCLPLANNGLSGSLYFWVTAFVNDCINAM